MFAVPANTIPTATIPTATIPTATIPTATIPTATIPTATIPTGTNPRGTIPTGTRPAGTRPAGAAPMPSWWPDAHPVRIAADFAADGGWRARLRFAARSRWSQLLHATDGVEVWLLSWLPGQHTELHDHGAADGAFTVVAGRLTDRVVRAAPPGETLHELSIGQSRVFGPGYVHQVTNGGAEPAASIHVYRTSRAGQRHYRWDPLTGTLHTAGRRSEP